MFIAEAHTAYFLTVNILMQLLPRVTQAMKRLMRLRVRRTHATLPPIMPAHALWQKCHLLFSLMPRLAFYWHNTARGGVKNGHFCHY